MRRILGLFPVVLLAVVLTGCGPSLPEEELGTIVYDPHELPAAEKEPELPLPAAEEESDESAPAPSSDPSSGDPPD